MSDLISRSKAIEYIKNIVDDKDQENITGRILTSLYWQPAECAWIPVEERMPENAQHEGAFCPKYQVMTTWGQTVGWYNPDFESWYIVLWFMTGRCLAEEIDFERADIPRVVKVNKNSGIVIAWMPLPDPYNPHHEEA